MTRHRANPAPPGPPSKHPDLEQVAAFLDGRLSGDERRRMVVHLAACDACHELMAETAELMRPEEGMEEEGVDGTTEGEGPARPPASVLRPHSGVWRRHLPVIAALAAAALIALAIWTPLLDRFGAGPVRPVPVGELAQGLPSGDPSLLAALERPDVHGWPVVRGDAPALTQGNTLAFRLGVRNAELAATLAVLATAEGRSPEPSAGSPPAPTAPGAPSGDATCVLPPGSHPARRTACVLVARILQLLEGGDSPGFSLVATAYHDLRDALLAGASAESLQEIHSTADQILGSVATTDDPGIVDDRFYALGKWAGAARLALAADELEWFRSPRHRRLLERLATGDFPAPVDGFLVRLERTVGEGGPAPTEVESFAADLAALIRIAGGGAPDAAASR